MRIQRFSVGGEDRICPPPRFYTKRKTCTALLHSQLELDWALDLVILSAALCDNALIKTSP